MRWNKDLEAASMFVRVMAGVTDQAQAIAESEEKGQKAFIGSRTEIPKYDCHRNLIDKSWYESVGIEITGEYDNEFYSCVMSKDTKFIPLSTFWTDLTYKGQKVASIFFKASVYDYHAHINFI